MTNASAWASMSDFHCDVSQIEQLQSFVDSHCTKCTKLSPIHHRCNLMHALWLTPLNVHGKTQLAELKQVSNDCQITINLPTVWCVKLFVTLWDVSVPNSELSDASLKWKQFQWMGQCLPTQNNFTLCMLTCFMQLSKEISARVFLWTIIWRCSNPHFPLEPLTKGLSIVPSSLKLTKIIEWQQFLVTETAGMWHKTASGDPFKLLVPNKEWAFTLDCIGLNSTVIQLPLLSQIFSKLIDCG